MEKVYVRTEDGQEETVTVRVALKEVNYAMMEGRRYVREMSSQHGLHVIEYKDGRSVRLELVDDPQIVMEPKTDCDRTHADIRVMAAQMALYADLLTPQDTAPWSTASHRMLLHRFTEASKDGRAVCNKGFRPHQYGNGFNFKTRAEHEADRYAHLYTFCPRCSTHR